MADMYQVEDLKMDCTEFLKKNLTDDNVMEVWMGTHSLDVKSLSAAVLEHLADRPSGKSLKDIPGFSEAFQSPKNPLKDLVELLSEQKMTMKEDSEFVHCPSLSCKRKVSKAKLLDHVDIDNKKEDFCRKDCGYKVACAWIVKDSYFQSESIWVPTHIKFGGQHFFLEMWRSAFGVWALWLYQLGTHKRCKEFRYTIKLFPKDRKEDKELTYRGRTVAMDHSKELQGDFMGNCLAFSDVMAKQLLVEERIQYKVIIEPVA